MSGPRIYYGWWIVVTAAIGMSTGPGQFAFGALGLFMIPLGDEFGWSRTEISLALTFFTVALALAIPYIGTLVDRHGSRNVLLPSFLVFGVLLALIPVFADRLWVLYLLFFLIGSLAAGSNALPYLRTISAWFDRRRGLALGIAMGGSGMGYVYVPPAVQYMIDHHGWRSGYFLLAVVTVVVAVPLVYFVLRESPTARDLEGVDELHSAPIAANGGGDPAPFGALLRQPLLWLLFVIFCGLSFCLYGVLSHLVPMLRDRGMDPGSAALVQSTLGMALVVSRILIGYIVDRVFAPHVAVGCFLLSAAGIALLAYGAIDAVAFLAVVGIGISMGAEIDMLAFLTGRYFGVENFGRVYGILFTSFLIGTSLGPVGYGYAFETLGSYDWVLFLSIGLMLASAVLTIRLPRYEDGRRAVRLAMGKSTEETT
ncbi:MFS transporter [Elongatibacter sediminis]|uniref:MFS transporter n=1 Tax=Elongatibacter sediminis TaxID=3119006 RepID=A0AAW9RA36_9GAMM